MIECWLVWSDNETIKWEIAFSLLDLGNLFKLLLFSTQRIFSQQFSWCKICNGRERMRKINIFFFVIVSHCYSADVLWSYYIWLITILLSNNKTFYQFEDSNSEQFTQCKSKICLFPFILAIANLISIIPSKSSFNAINSLKSHSLLF